jgi:type IV pilus assembly PilX-like protein
MRIRARARPVRRSGSGEEGFALLLAILLLFVLTVAGLALMFAAASEQTLSSYHTMASKTFYAADSGVQYAAAELATNVNYVGGQLPVGLSTHYPGVVAPDIGVTVTRPINIGFTIHPGDQIQSQGSSYGSSQIVENFYNFTSTAEAASIQSRKTVTTAVGIYPQLLVIPK